MSPDNSSSKLHAHDQNQNHLLTNFYHSDICIKLKWWRHIGYQRQWTKLCLFHCSPFLTYFLTLLLPSQVQQIYLPSLQNPSFYPYYSCPSALFYVFSLSSKSSFTLISPRRWGRGSIIPTHSLTTDQHFPHSPRAHNPTSLLLYHQPGPNLAPDSN